MKKNQIKVSVDERNKMDEIDKKQQDAIELLSFRIESLIWTLIVLTVVTGSCVIFYWAFK